jgi:hypothetical protein
MARKWSTPLKAKEITIALIHPGMSCQERTSSMLRLELTNIGAVLGWVDSTDMGNSIVEWVEKNPSGLTSITVEQSAAGVTKVLHDLKIEDTGSFYNYDGTPLPW